MGQPETVSPFCVPAISIRDDQDRLVTELRENHQSCRELVLPSALVTRRLTLRLTSPEGGAPAALFAVRCYS